MCCRPRACARRIDPNRPSESPHHRSGPPDEEATVESEPPLCTNWQTSFGVSAERIRQIEAKLYRRCERHWPLTSKRFPFAPRVLVDFAVSASAPPLLRRGDRRPSPAGAFFFASDNRAMEYMALDASPFSPNRPSGLRPARRPCGPAFRPLTATRGRARSRGQMNAQVRQSALSVGLRRMTGFAWKSGLD